MRGSKPMLLRGASPSSGVSGAIADKQLKEEVARIQQDIVIISQKIADLGGEPAPEPDALSASPFVVSLRSLAEPDKKSVKELKLSALEKLIAKMGEYDRLLLKETAPVVDPTAPPVRRKSLGTDMFTCPTHLHLSARLLDLHTQSKRVTVIKVIEGGGGGTAGMHMHRAGAQEGDERKVLDSLKATVNKQMVQLTEVERARLSAEEENGYLRRQVVELKEKEKGYMGVMGMGGMGVGVNGKEKAVAQTHTQPESEAISSHTHTHSSHTALEEEIVRLKQRITCLEDTITLLQERLEIEMGTVQGMVAVTMGKASRISNHADLNSTGDDCLALVSLYAYAVCLCCMLMLYAVCLCCVLYGLCCMLMLYAYAVCLCCMLMLYAVCLCCVLYGLCCVLYAVCLCCMLMLYAVCLCCVLYAVCCMLCAVCCMLYAVCCMLRAVCCMLYASCTPIALMHPAALTLPPTPLPVNSFLPPSYLPHTFLLPPTSYLPPTYLPPSLPPSLPPYLPPYLQPDNARTAFAILEHAVAARLESLRSELSLVISLKDILEGELNTSILHRDLIQKDLTQSTEQGDALKAAYDSLSYEAAHAQHQQHQQHQASQKNEHTQAQAQEGRETELLQRAEASHKLLEEELQAAKRKVLELERGPYMVAALEEQVALLMAEKNRDVSVAKSAKEEVVSYMII
jgi:hypothetical protein